VRKVTQWVPTTVALALDDYRPCVGIAIGLVNIWTAVPVPRRALGLPLWWCGLVVGDLLFLLGAVTIALDSGPAASTPDWWARIIAFAAVPPLIMAIPRRAT